MINTASHSKNISKSDRNMKTPTSPRINSWSSKTSNIKLIFLILTVLILSLNLYAENNINNTKLKVVQSDLQKSIEFRQQFISKKYNLLSWLLSDDECKSTNSKNTINTKKSFKKNLKNISSDSKSLKTNSNKSNIIFEFVETIIIKSDKKIQLHKKGAENGKLLYGFLL